MESREPVLGREVPGEEVPDPLGKAAKDLFGISYLFPYQRLVIANILEAAETSPQEEDRSALGRQIVILPTGAGKSLCFQLPAMLLPGPTLVIYPILSLMADQERRLRERGFEPALLRGGQSPEERRALWEQVKSGESRILIANPEVLLTEGVMNALKEINISHLVIDEAHCVSEWGESFRPSYLRIGEIIEALSGRPLVTAFTATASAPVLEKIERFIFGSRGARRIIGNPDRSNISYGAAGALQKNAAVRDLLARLELPAIVFCSSRRGTEELAAYLRQELPRLRDIPREEIRFYHAGLSREEKNAGESWFFQSPGGILTATCAYGMGVDKANIRTVLHRDCPSSVEAYLQESGRAGRDGAQSLAILLWGPEDEERLKLVQKDTDKRRLEQLLAYGRNTRRCRREALLGMLNYEGAGEAPSGPGPETPCCDVCEGKALALPREEETLLRFFRQNPRRYTLAEAGKALAGAERLNWSAEEAGACIKILAAQNKLKISTNRLWKGKITALSG